MSMTVEEIASLQDQVVSATRTDLPLARKLADDFYTAARGEQTPVSLFIAIIYLVRYGINVNELDEATWTAPADGTEAASILAAVVGAEAHSDIDGAKRVLAQIDTPALLLEVYRAAIGFAASP